MAAPVLASHACTGRILEAALAVFCKDGYNASIDAVAQRAKVARQTIYNHFGSKEALFEAALERASADLFAKLETGDGDLRERLIRFGLEFRARVLNPESINLHRVLTSEAPRFPELATSFYNNCVMRCCKQMSRLIDNAMREGRLRRDDPLEAAQLLVEILVGFDRLGLLFGAPAPKPAAEKARVARLIDLFLRAYATVPAAALAVRSGGRR
jgi:AcrR family transcriptional regulator